MPIRRIDPSRDTPKNAPASVPASTRSVVASTIVPRPRTRRIDPSEPGPASGTIMSPSNAKGTRSALEDAARRQAKPHRSGPNWDEEGNYKIGKGKPPLAHQFSPGVSGNPKGPKKGSRTYTSQAKEIFGYAVDVKIGGKTKKYDSAGVSMIKLREAASQGDLTAIDKTLKAHREIFPDEVAEAQSGLTEAEQASVDGLLAAAGYLPNPVVRAKPQIPASSDTEKDDEI